MDARKRIKLLEQENEALRGRRRICRRRTCRERLYPLVHELAADGIPVVVTCRVGAAGDNTAMESFFALLQNNVLNRRTWPTRDELRMQS